MKKPAWKVFHVYAWLLIAALLVAFVLLRQNLNQPGGYADHGGVLPIADSRPSAVLGLDEARLHTGERIYVSTANRDLFIAGNLFQVTPTGVINLTEVALRKDRLADLAGVPVSSALTFPADDEKALVTVFTDVSCGYCQLFHQEVPRLNEMGISVRYLAFPREGLRSEAASRMAAVWCASQPQDALGQAFQGMDMPSTGLQRNCDAAISTGFELGQLLGVRGTPAIVLPNGELGSGHLPAQQLAEAVRVSMEEVLP